MKELTLERNNDFFSTITLSDNYVKEKKEERKKLADDISQLLSKRCTLIDKKEYYGMYRWCIEYGI